MARKRYSPKLKFQVVLEALAGEKTLGHPCRVQADRQRIRHPSQFGGSLEEAVSGEGARAIRRRQHGAAV